MAQVQLPGRLHPFQFHGGQHSDGHQPGGQRGERQQCAAASATRVGWDVFVDLYTRKMGFYSDSMGFYSDSMGY